MYATEKYLPFFLAYWRDYVTFILDRFSGLWKSYLPFIPFFLPIWNVEMITGAIAVMLQTHEWEFHPGVSDDSWGYCTNHWLQKSELLWYERKKNTHFLSHCYLGLELCVSTLSLSVLQKLIAEAQVGSNQVIRWIRQWGFLVHRNKVICQNQEVGAFRLQDISPGHQCALHVLLPVRALRKRQSSVILEDFSMAGGGVGRKSAH